MEVNRRLRNYPALLCNQSGESIIRTCNYIEDSNIYLYTIAQVKKLYKIYSIVLWIGGKLVSQQYVF